MNTLSPLPFPRAQQLCRDLDTVTPDLPTCTVLPGQPCLPLDDSVALAAFLAKDLIPEELEKTASRLWVMSTQSSSNINPLHHQIVKGREIVVTEQAQLHLIWNNSRIFIKPLPGTFSHTHSGNISSQINLPGSVTVAVQYVERR